MKVRIEFDNSDDEDHDPESVYDTVEFSADVSDSVMEWGFAVYEFANAGRLFRTELIMAKAFSHALECCDDYFDWDGFWDGFIEDLEPCHRNKLIAAVAARGTTPTTPQP